LAPHRLCLHCLGVHTPQHNRLRRGGTAGVMAGSLPVGPNSSAEHGSGTVDVPDAFLSAGSAWRGPGFPGLGDEWKLPTMHAQRGPLCSPGPTLHVLVIPFWDPIFASCSVWHKFKFLYPTGSGHASFTTKTHLRSAVFRWAGRKLTTIAWTHRCHGFAPAKPQYLPFSRATISPQCWRWS
jgi:hypothetical protein